MKILVLDDIKHRHDVFDKRHEGEDISHAYRYHEFVDKLENDGPWDLVYLDHDLGDFVKDADFKIDGWGNRREYDGQDAAARVCELENPPKKIIIQSVNPIGGRAMLQILKKKGLNVSWVPFNDDPLDAA